MTTPDQMPDAAGRIEGGIDAIVIGAGLEGLAVATYLARQKLRTVLVDGLGEIGGANQLHKIDDDFSITDGDPVLTHLDPKMIADLELYRFGLEFADRRLSTTYFFDDAEPWSAGGDIAAPTLSQDLTRDEQERFAAFIGAIISAGEGFDNELEQMLTAIPGASVRGENNHKPAPHPFPVSASLADLLNEKIDDERLRAAMCAEASVRAGVSPSEPFSALSLIHRYSGEAAGLRGARAYPRGGLPNLLEALRRSAQAAGVTIKMLTPVTSILIEGDRVAGVQLKRGGQLRAPIVVSALDLHRSFFDFIGEKKLDVSYVQALRAPAPFYARAYFHAVLDGAPSDEATAAFMQNRLVFAPAIALLEKSFAHARRGEVPADLILDVIFPDAIEGATTSAAPRLSVGAYPLPFLDAPDVEARKNIETAILAQLAKLIPGISDQLAKSVLRLGVDISSAADMPAPAFGAASSIPEQAARAHSALLADGIAGLYYCGPDAEIGGALSGRAARITARRAGQDIRNGRYSS